MITLEEVERVHLWKKSYTAGEVADMLGVTRNTVWRWCKEGKVKAWRTPGGQYRIPREEVERLMHEYRGE